jgi:hypothetical protein
LRGDFLRLILIQPTSYCFQRHFGHTDKIRIIMKN